MGGTIGLNQDGATSKLSGCQSCSAVSAMALSVCFYVTAASKGWRLSRSLGRVSGVASPPAVCPALQRDRLCAVDKRRFCGSCGSLCFL